MTPDLPNLEKIEDYLNGIMPDDQRTAFENELNEDASLKKEFDLVQDMLMGIEQLGDDVLKTQISAAHQELKGDGFFEKKTAKVVVMRPAKHRWYRWAAAASLLVIFGAVLFFMLNREDNYQKWYTQNFRPEDEKIATVIDDLTASGMLATDREKRESLANALKRYQQGEYTSAKDAFTIHLQNYRPDTVAQFYLALSELHLSNIEKAIASLKPITPQSLNPDVRPGQVSRGVDFQHEMTWYLALAYSKRGDRTAKDSTLILLRKLVSSGDDNYAAKAQTALQQLE